MSDSLTWRSDIQTLRGVAVLAVVIYHSGITLGGGFAGVDVFFVISGYVIASSLQRQMNEEGTLSILAFYSRRFRRLVPNYVLVVTVTLALSHLFFDPYLELPQIKWAAFSSFLASTNIYFLFTDRYDALVGNPLRHLWSLGVGEHFYLLLPWLYLLVAKRTSDPNLGNRRVYHIAFWFGSISLASSLLIVYLANGGFAGISRATLLRLNFFGSPLRFWEILAGVVIAHVHRVSVGVTTTRVLRWSAGGVLLVTFSVLDDPERFPNVWAAVVVAATSVLIAFPVRASSNLRFITRPLEVLGNVSYAWYLWHWPIFVILHREFGVTLTTAVTGTGVSLVVAVITTRWVEDPFHKRHLPAIRIAPLLVLGIAIIVGAVWLGRSATFYGLFPRAEAKESNFATVNGCGWSSDGWEDQCVFGKSDTGGVRLVLLGDSNARSASDGLIAAAETNKWSITLGVRTGCPVLFSKNQVDPECAKLNAERLRFLRDTRPDAVILVNHWLNYRGFGAFGNPEAWTRGMRDTIRSISRLDIPVVIQHQIPECRTSNSLLRSVLSDRGWEDAYLCRSAEDSVRYVNAVITGLEAICSNRKESNCLTVDVVESLCQSRETCRAFVGRTNYFSDATHISPSASRLTSDQYSKAIRAILKSE